MASNHVGSINIYSRKLSTKGAAPVQVQSPPLFGGQSDHRVAVLFVRIIKNLFYLGMDGLALRSDRAKLG
jgi:hypothetical protein